MVDSIHDLVKRQNNLYRMGATLPLETRATALRALRDGIRFHEREILEALELDLGKSASEAYMCEVGLVLGEITYQLRNMQRLARKRPVRTPLTHTPARCYEQASPLGTVLIMSPWNYPFLLTMEPLVDAVAAGNTAVVKPSAYSPATSEVMARLIAELFPADYITCVQGGRAQNEGLLDEAFDLIFFTGSQAVGKHVMRKAAERVTPVVLELGGKSPCIVEASANMAVAARRIVWGKFLNCGQTCVAPDYVLCDETVAVELTQAMEHEIRRQFGDDPLKNEAYGKIINEKHFDRLVSLLPAGSIGQGGRFERQSLKIEPTIVVDASWDSPIMQEEIFGPLLPIVTYRSLDEALERVTERPKPLALYVFSERREEVDRILAKCAFGGGCVNDTVIHLATSHMRFGGVGESGMGSYHGDAGFHAFSHVKSIVDRKTWIDPPMRYQPFTKLNDLLVRFCLH